jgi:hypothetical protein
MNVRDLTRAEKEELQRRGATWLVIVKHPRSASEKEGDLVSWHESHDAADRGAGSSSSLRVINLRYVHTYQDAWKGLMDFAKGLALDPARGDVHSRYALPGQRRPAANDDEPAP